MKYRIRDIENFVETCSHGTIMQAARRLEISQPALSESIHRLESDSGLVFFYRSRTGIRLTSSGRSFLRKAEKVLLTLSELEVSNLQKNLFAGRVVTIGCHATVAQYCIPAALASLRAKSPDFRVELRHDLSRNIQSSIQKGETDIGVIINAVSVPDSVVKKVAEDRVSVWIADALTESDTVICDPELFQTQSILKKWKGHPLKLLPTGSLELVCRMVERKLGYGIIPDRAVALGNYKLRKLESLPSYRDEISLVFRPEFGRVLHERLVIQALEGAFSPSSDRKRPHE